MRQSVILSFKGADNRPLSSFSRTSVFDIPNSQKEILGNRSLIVVEPDDISQQIAQHLWAKMQRVGKEAVTCNVRSAFTTKEGVEEGVDLAKRAGIESIIAIGEETAINTGKAVRDYLENGVPSTHVSAKCALQILSTSVTESNYTVPLVAVPASLTPYTSMPLWKGLHAEDDYIQNFSCRAPDMIVWDLDVMKAPLDVPTRLHLFAHLFDVIFCYVLNREFLLLRKEKHGENVIITEALGNTEQRILSLMQRKDFTPLLQLLLEVGLHEGSPPPLPSPLLTKNESEATLFEFCDVCEAIDRLRMQLYILPCSSDAIAGFDYSVGLLSQIVDMRLLYNANALEQHTSSMGIPSSLVMVDTLQKILMTNSLYEIHESCSMQEMAVRRSFLNTLTILGLCVSNGEKSTGQLRMTRTELAQSIIRSDTLASVSSNLGIGIGTLLNGPLGTPTMNAAGVLAGQMFTEESSVDEHFVKAVSNMKKARIKLEGNDYRKGLAQWKLLSPKLSLLSSDFLLDIAEESLKVV